jgi:hypothetical protein
MTKKDKLNRIKEIEIQQILLLPEVEALRSIVNSNPEDAVAPEILEQKIEELGIIRKEKALLLLNLGFQITGISIDEPFVNTEMWKQIDVDLEFVPLDTSNLRYSICTGCPEFVAISKQCKKCACFMESKTKLAGFSCPIGKW